MYETILVPLDGSALAEAVLPHVEELAKRLGSKVVLVHVEDSLSKTFSRTADPEMIGGPNVEVVAEQFHAQHASGEHYLVAVAKRLEDAGLKAEVQMMEGTPSTAILDYLRTHDFSLVAMSTHGRTGLERLVFGSVAEAVLRNSPVPTLVIRPRF